MRDAELVHDPAGPPGSDPPRGTGHRVADGTTTRTRQAFDPLGEPDFTSVRALAQRLEHSLAEPASEDHWTRYAERAAAWPAVGWYGMVPEALAESDADIERALGATAAVRLRRRLIAHLVGRSLQGAVDEPTIRPGRASIERAFRQILGMVERGPDARYALAQDRFVKDLQIARLRLLPTGPFLVDRYQGFSRAAFLRGRGPLGVPRAVLDYLALGGSRPWHEMHAYDLGMRHVSAAGWSDFLQVARGLVEQDPSFRGFIGTGWWYDPAIADVSPHLAFMRRVPASIGARFYIMPPSSDAVAYAVANSPERAALVASGTYQPRNWMVAIPRDLLLARAP